MERIQVLGVSVDPLTIAELNDLVRTAIDQKERWIIAHHNLHSIYLYHRDEKMRRFFANAKIAHIDGMSLVFWARIMGFPLRRQHRVTYVDWVQPLMEMAAAEGWRVFYLGGRPGVADRASKKLQQQYPKITIATLHGYFSQEENNVVLSMINDFQPHILMVGMGMPRQEHWIHDNFDQIQANVILTAGACFDYLAGEVPIPPRWLGQVGLEWLYRLIIEPRRLSYRYLVEPWSLIRLIINDIFRRFR